MGRMGHIGLMGLNAAVFAGSIRLLGQSLPVPGESYPCK